MSCIHTTERSSLRRLSTEACQNNEANCLVGKGGHGLIRLKSWACALKLSRLKRTDYMHTVGKQHGETLFRNPRAPWTGKRCIRMTIAACITRRERVLHENKSHARTRWFDKMRSIPIPRIVFLKLSLEPYLEVMDDLEKVYSCFGRACRRQIRLCSARRLTESLGDLAHSTSAVTQRNSGNLAQPVRNPMRCVGWGWVQGRANGTDAGTHAAHCLKVNNPMDREYIVNVNKTYDMSDGRFTRWFGGPCEKMPAAI